MSKHTPGPWVVGQVENTAIVGKEWTDDFGLPHALTIATISNWRDGHESNADLIAAAPELLEAVSIPPFTEFIGLFKDDEPDDVEIPVVMNVGQLRAIHAAIAKAEGGAS